MAKNPKKFEIINGNGKELDISPVYEHISTDKPKSAKQEKKDIVIPSNKDSKKKNK